jgi:putative addiction module component (TIGR02574 family)
MSQTYADLEREARQLSAEERARLVDALLDSLRTSPAAEIEAEWAMEIERRITAYERGEAVLVPAEEVFAKARRIAGE